MKIVYKKHHELKYINPALGGAVMLASVLQNIRIRKRISALI
jgi:hypothetical protein